MTDYGTAHWQVEASVCPPEERVMGQANPPGIARNPGRQREWFGRGKRKASIVSKAMMERTMALLARFLVKGYRSEMFTLEMIA